MALSDDDIRHLARLARLDLDAERIASIARELDEIIGYVEQLRAVDTTGVEPVADVAGLVNVTREDQPGAMLDREQVLANAPKANAEAFLVPKAVDR